MYFVLKAATSILRPGRDFGCMPKIIFFSSRILVGLLKNITSAYKDLSCLWIYRKSWQKGKIFL